MARKNNANENTGMAERGGFAEIANIDLIQEAMNDECAGLEFSLDRIKIPSGGMTAFEVPTGDGETTELEKEIECVILLSHPANAFYREAYKGGSNPPDCGSFDGEHGDGVPGGNCRTCPYNQFGSGDGKAKACKNRRMLYIQREGEAIPMMLNLPTGSLRAFTKYAQSVLCRGRRLNQVVTRISLRKASSSSSIEFSQAVFKCVRPLNPKEQASVDALAGIARAAAARLTTAHLAEPADDIPEIPAIDPETGEAIEPLN